MLKNKTIQLRELTRKALVSAVLVAVVGLSFASKGGGGEKKKNNNIPLRTEFVPIRTTNNFTLKAGPVYRGSYIMGEERTKSYVAINAVATYQKGNSIYILPFKYKVSSNVSLNSGVNKSNLQLLDLHIRMHK